MLVVIDAKSLIYKRYSGKTCTLKVKAEEPLLKYEVELLRVNPGAILPPEEPELA